MYELNDRVSFTEKVNKFSTKFSIVVILLKFWKIVSLY
jgi:hypothetical protein